MRGYFGIIIWYKSRDHKLLLGNIDWNCDFKNGDTTKLLLWGIADRDQPQTKSGDLWLQYRRLRQLHVMGAEEATEEMSSCPSPETGAEVFNK